MKKKYMENFLRDSEKLSQLAKKKLKISTLEIVPKQALINIIIPPNKLGITAGYYSLNDFAHLLVGSKYNSDKIQFLAEMLEN